MRADVASEARRVVRRAKDASQTLITVESCTAGALASALANVGASDVLHGGFVVYTKENKMAAVGVPRALLEAHTAVSAPVAKAMAHGGIEYGPADIAVRSPVSLDLNRTRMAIPSA